MQQLTKESDSRKTPLEKKERETEFIHEKKSSSERTQTKLNQEKAKVTPSKKELEKQDELEAWSKGIDAN